MYKCAEVWLLLAVVGCSGAGAGSGSGGAGGEAGAGAASGSGGKGGADARGADGSVSGPDAAIPMDLAPDPPSVEFCAAYAGKFCERLRTCSPPYLTGVYGSPAACQERVDLECRTQAVLPGAGLNEATGMACAEAMGAASCEDLLGNSVALCRIKGTLARGAACGSDNQCQTGFCRTPETAFCGKCDTAGVAGAPCDANDACEFPLLCSEAGRCARASAEGEFCNESRPCKTGPLFCAADNTCKRPSAEGKACNRSAPAPLQPCEIGFSCRPSANGLCRAIRLVEAGQPCGISGGTVVLCTGSGSCVNGVCRPPGQDGERCTPSPLGDSGGCLAPALCLEGLCKLPDPASCQ